MKVNMKQVILLHNPNAGDEDHFKSELTLAIETEGYQCIYFSVKNDDAWKKELDRADLAVVAGGDGTVRKVVKELLKRTAPSKRITIALLPMGTANNLSKTLFLDKETSFESHIKAWKSGKRQRFDIGILAYDSITNFFIEGAGYGIFPTLIWTMEKLDISHLKTTEEQLQLAYEKLYQIILTAEAHQYTIRADSQTYEDRYLLLEVMNIPSIGPNLILAPASQIDDGFLDVVMISEKERLAFAQHVRRTIQQEKTSFDFRTLRAKNIEIQSADKNIHIDDKYIIKTDDLLTITIKEHVLDFLK